MSIAVDLQPSRMDRAITSDAAVLETRGLGRRFGELWAARGIDLSLAPGVIGLLGPNGAGKSTLLNMLATVTAPSEGEIRFDGRPLGRSPGSYRSALGFAPQAVNLPMTASCRELLLYIAALKGLARGPTLRQIEALAAALNLTPQMTVPVRDLSGGMRRRLNVIQALLGDPRVILLDEPTAELDALEKLALQRLIGELAARAVIIVSTHIVSDVEAVASRVAVMSKGRIVADDTPQRLAAGLAGRVWTCTVPVGMLGAVARTYLVTAQRRTADGMEVRIVGTTDPPEGARPETPMLEDAYLAGVTGGRADARSLPEPGEVA